MKLITANKLNRLWKNGIVPSLAKKIDKTKVLTTAEQVAANTNAENLPSAVVVGELYNDLNGYSFGETADGEPGYRKPGADTVTPFKGIPKSLDLGVSYGNGLASDYRTSSFNLSTKITKYKKLKLWEDLFVQIKNVYLAGNSMGSGNYNFEISYNPDTGMLTIKGSSTYFCCTSIMVYYF